MNRHTPAADSPLLSEALPVTAAAVTSVVHALLRELRGASAPAPALDDDLERTLGIDSLARMELMLRLEQTFDASIAESQMQSAQTPRDLLRALASAPRRVAGVRRAEPQIDLQAPTAVAAELPQEATSLVEVIRWHAERAGERRHVALWNDGDVSQALSYAQLWQRAQAMAAALQRLGLAPDETVSLMLPTSLAFLECFAGILLAGGVPVPIYPPFRLAQIEDHLSRQALVLDNAGAVMLICDDLVLPAARILHAGAPRLREVLTVDRLRALAGDWQPVARAGPDIALIQYTSGSTGQPKGVVLTHANLLANIRAMGRAVNAQPHDVFVSWLPLYHDMGLIGAWLASLYHGMALLLMPPQAFLARPSRWLRAISDGGGTISGAPNFAYEIAATRLPDDELQGIDLSHWRAALNGAEPVHAATLAAFGERFAAYGLDRRALMPVYGLAEAGVGLAFPPLGRGPKIDVIDRIALRDHGRADPVDHSAPAALQVVCCGVPLPAHELRVVDASGAELPDRHEGHVQFRGPSATGGYFRNAPANKALFHADWLDTGDLGYLLDGEVCLTSRAKDLIIRGGHNVHPYDLEEAVGALPGVRRGCVAVFGAADPASRSERVVVLAETRVHDAAALAALRGTIVQRSIDLIGLPPDDVVLAPPHAVLKTSSGKIRRAACRDLYERGALGRSGRPVIAQWLSLWAGALRRRLGESLRRFARAASGGWLAALFGIGVGLAIVAALLPGRERRKRAARAIARAGWAVSALPFEVRGQANLPPGNWIVASNHTSYADWVVLTAALPACACFVAKGELRRQAAQRWLLERFGVRFVERDDPREGVEDAARLVDAAKGGECLVFFPEGTFRRAPGVHEFRLGAFVAAARAGVPIVPVGLRGTRTLLREGSWWPRRAPIVVTIDAPLRAGGTGWADALALRDRTRERIAHACGEPVRDG